MIFDDVCKIMDRFAGEMPTLASCMQTLSIFKLDYASFDTLENHPSAEELDFLAHNFHLPFPVVAIEDNASCVILIDMYENQVGLNTPRLFIELQSAASSKACMFGDFAGDSEDEKIMDSYPEGTCLIQLGRIHPQPVHTSKQWVADAVLFDVTMMCPDSIVFPPGTLKSLPDELQSQLLSAASKSAMTAIEQIRLLNAPSRLVFETEPVDIDNSPFIDNPNRIRRSSERAVFSLLTPEQISVALGQSSGQQSGESQSRNYRTVTNVRFTESPGHTVTIPASWVRDTQGVHDHRRYRVHVDL